MNWQKELMESQGLLQPAGALGIGLPSASPTAFVMQTTQRADAYGGPSGTPAGFALMVHNEPENPVGNPLHAVDVLVHPHVAPIYMSTPGYAVSQLGCGPASVSPSASPASAHPSFNARVPLVHLMTGSPVPSLLGVRGPLTVAVMNTTGVEASQPASTVEAHAMSDLQLKPRHIPGQLGLPRPRIMGLGCLRLHQGEDGRAERRGVDHSAEQSHHCLRLDKERELSGDGRLDATLLAEADAQAAAHLRSLPPPCDKSQPPNCSPSLCEQNLKKSLSFRLGGGGSQTGDRRGG